MLAGLRRILAILAALTLATVAGSVAVAALSGGSVTAALATGLYIVGSFFVLLGVVAGVRGPLRGKSDEGEPQAALFGLGLAARGVRTASGDERHDAQVTALLFLALGFALILFGVAADSSVELI